MKKIIFPILCLAAIATGCQVVEVEDQETPVTENSFKIVASIGEDTKTTYTPPLSVAWDADDDLAVLVKVGDAYENFQFVKSESEDNVFECTNYAPTGTVTEYNVFYPYNKYHTTIDAEGYSSSYVTIGSSASGMQSQNGVGDAAHIDAPLCGYTTDITNGVAMKHVSTLFDVKLTNSTASDIVVTKVSLTNNESKSMVGSFYFNPQTQAVKESKGYVSPTANLNVTSGTVNAGIGTNGTAPASFYITSAPFKLATGSTITITITTNDGATYETVKTMKEDMDFVAGSVNHLSVEISQLQEVERIAEGEYLIGAYYSGSWYLMSNTVSSSVYSAISTDITTALEAVTCSEFYYVTTVPDYVWTLTDSGSSYSLQNNATGKYYSANTSHNALSSDTAADLTILKNEDGTYNVTISTDPTYSLAFNYNSGNSRFKPYLITSSYPKVILIPWTAPSVPIVYCTTANLDYTYSQTTSGTVNYTIINTTYNDVSVSCADEKGEAITWLTAAKSEDGKISYSIQANESTEARTGIITISVSGGNSVTITVNQTGAPAADAVYYVKVTEAPTDWSGTYLIVYDGGTTPKIFSGSVSSTTTVYGLVADGEFVDSKIVKDDVTSAYEVVVNKVGDYYTLNCNAGYLYWISTGSSSALNNLNAGAFSDADNYKWNISIVNSVVSITNVVLDANNSNVERYLQYNSSNTRFACYRDASNMKNISLYKLQE